MATGSFWPLSLGDDHEPTAILDYTSLAATDSGVVLGCRDGFLRRFDPSYSTDDGSIIKSHVVYGPIKLSGNDYEEGLFTELVGALGENSGFVQWDVRVGTTAEASVKTPTVFAFGEWASGLNHKAHVRARGNSCTIKVRHDRGSKWSIERMTGVRRPAGKQRLA